MVREHRLAAHDVRDRLFPQHGRGADGRLRQGLALRKARRRSAFALTPARGRRAPGNEKKSRMRAKIGAPPACQVFGPTVAEEPRAPGYGGMLTRDPCDPPSREQGSTSVVKRRRRVDW